MAELRVMFGTKFCQQHLDSVISEYWEQSFADETNVIIFDLSFLEWINTEEIAFLFSWIRNVAQRGKNVELWLPYPYDIFKDRIYTSEDDLKRAQGLINNDSPERIEKRRNRSVFLLSVWGMVDRIGIESIRLRNIVEGYHVKGSEKLSKFGHLVIPYTIINSEKPSSTVTNSFEDVINGLKVKVSGSSVGPFDLNPQIIQRLETFDCYSPFESKIISHVITKELFANSLIHSNITKNAQRLEECYFALILNDEWDPPKTKGQNFLDQFLHEKDKDTIDFYKDKAIIKKDIDRIADTLSKKQVDSYSNLQEADLSKYNREFKNEASIEFTFLDFGDGIDTTLAKKFNEYLQRLEGDSHFVTDNKETQILEYAFYPESSRNQYHARLEHPELFPRGLYFLVDMVRRYKGLLVVRSGSGKIVFDFSDKIYLKKIDGKIRSYLEPPTSVRDAIRINKSIVAKFDGTLVSIVLPKKKTAELSYEPVRADNKDLYRDIYLSKFDPDRLPAAFFAPETHEYISMLFLYERVITSIRPRDLAKPKGFDSFIYIELLNELKKHSHKKCIIFIDFEFYPRTDNIHQLLFYLTNSPYINEYAKAVIINLVDEVKVHDDEMKKEVYGILHEFKLNLFAVDNEPHIFRPIPCINFDMNSREKLFVKDLNWIGVKSSADEVELDKLFMGDIQKIRTSGLLNSNALGGSIFADHNDIKYAIFQTSLDLLREFRNAKQAAIVALINSLITDGLAPVADFMEKGVKEFFIFQASNGSFQTRYLSLYEALHNKYLAKFMAKNLLDKYLLNTEHPKFNKIITVTVSSQLIGVAIRDLIHEDSQYSTLKIGEGSSIECCPSLIVLSSYYSFEDEKPFAKINRNDNVLIVNDVISTGSLVYKLIEKIGLKSAKVKGIISIADCRIKVEPERDEQEEDSEFEKLDDQPMFTLVGYPVGEIEIRKYREKKYAVKAINEHQKQLNKNFIPLTVTDVDIKRINPLLNTVVELSDQYAEKQRILFENPLDLLPQETENLKIYQKKYFKIGHFEQNIAHNGYLTNMKPLFSSPEGTRLVRQIKEKIDFEYKTNLYNRKIDDSTRLFSMISIAEQLENPLIAKHVLEDLRLQLEVLPLIGNEKISSDISYSPDFIFYPIFSGIENFSHKKFHEIFKTDFENIIGLQRFDTDKGWRFPFPPKRFNNITRGKNVLIFDSGTLTGESLVQMIDSISVLEVAKIDVISIIGRIEDYNREFFSRIKSLKVKTLREEDDEETPADQHSVIEHSDQKISFSNLNIIFGMNLHIPVYSAKSTCPFCEELVEMESYEYTHNFPTATWKYIEKRKNDIRKIELNHDTSYEVPSYIPYLERFDDKNKSIKEFDIVSIFLMRDKLGKIDSYRFYKEYYAPFDKDIIDHLEDENDIYANREVLNQIELIMICILHEPRLFKVHKDLLVNIYEQSRSILDDLINGRELESLTYVWSKSSILHLVWLFHREKVLEFGFMEAMFHFTADDDEGLSYLSFQIFKTINKKTNVTDREKCIKILFALSHKLEYELNTYFKNHPKVRPIITDLITFLNVTEIKSINDAFHNLRLFFENRHPDNRHNQLKEKISYLRSRVKNNLISDIDEMIVTAQSIIVILKEEILYSLNKIMEISLFKKVPSFESELLFGANGSVIENLNKIIFAYEQITRRLNSDKPQVIFQLLSSFTNILVEFQFGFLKSNSIFYKFCKKYPCDLSTALTTVWENENQEDNNKFQIEILNLVEENIFVNMHQAYLVNALTELINNSFKEENNRAAVITFNAFESNGGVTFTMHQNRPFIDKKISHEGGLSKTVVPFFTAFCGTDKINQIKGPDDYLIEIEFTLSENQTN